MKAIMYHYVRKGRVDLPFFRYLSFDNFRRQLDYFEKYFGFLSYESIKKNFVEKNEKLFYDEKDKVILTFDDGFKDHYRYVFPELLDRGITGIFYVPTAIWNGCMLDVHKIHCLLGKFGGKKAVELAKTKINKSMIAEQDYVLFCDKTYIDQNNDEYTNFFKKIFNYYIKMNIEKRF